MLRPNSEGRGDRVVDAAIGVIAEHGLAGVTVRGIAARIHVAPPTLLAWFGSRDRFVRIIALTYCDRWTKWIHGRMYEHGTLALLPGNDDEIVWTRVWMAICDLARRDDDIAYAVGRTVDFERWVVRSGLKTLCSPPTPSRPRWRLLRWRRCWPLSTDCGSRRHAGSSRCRSTLRGS